MCGSYSVKVRSPTLIGWALLQTTAIAAATREDAKTIEEVYEPYLLQIGFINRTTRGRIVTEAACRHLQLF